MQVADFIKEFGEALDANSGVIFAGAGLSVPCGGPSWIDVLEKPRKTMGLPKSFQDLPLLAQYYIDNEPGGREVLENTIRTSLLKMTGPSIVHELISRLPVMEIWTTNYDTLFEQQLPDAQVFKDDLSIGGFWKAPGKKIIKMHGELPHDKADIEKIVISRQDYEQFQKRFPRTWAKLNSTFTTQRMLFLGLSFNDPNILHLLSLARVHYYLETPQHYVILRRPSDSASLKNHNLVVSDLRRSGIETVEISDFSEIASILSELVLFSAPSSVFIGGSFDASSFTAAEQFCHRLGFRLAEEGISVVSGANTPGRLVSQSVASGMAAKGNHDSNMITSYFQSRPAETLSGINRAGRIIFYGQSRTEMRREMLSKCRAAVFVGGSAGTTEEISICEAIGVPILSVPYADGAAKQHWNEVRTGTKKVNLFGLPLAPAQFEMLGRGPDVAAGEIVSLLKRSAVRTG
ncbi:SIR2-like domain-containing protein [Loktanella atrilutea]|uniref:NAD(+) hydrolase ThsA n=1 Tax=Loktanella atrilutea TaxID=366533 RepID=A0A1M5G5C7_LOKAT|nr:SIR2 family protein [Loktanella atrilutea]SHF98933.1 SIR2-like domain-containing protein [Loktanella atrilutea]